MNYVFSLSSSPKKKTKLLRWTTYVTVVMSKYSQVHGAIKSGYNIISKRLFCKMLLCMHVVRIYYVSASQQAVQNCPLLSQQLLQLYSKYQFQFQFYLIKPHQNFQIESKQCHLFLFDFDFENIHQHTKIQSLTQKTDNSYRQIDRVRDP